MQTNNYSSVFETLNKVDCKSHIEKKNGLSYLSWAWAWAILKKNYPTATFTIYENAEGWNYHTDGRTAWVKTGVTVEGVELIEDLPVMDNRNRSIPLDQVTSMDVIKAIQRALTKAVARHGLGLYIYAGEDLPEDVEEIEKKVEQKAQVPSPKMPSTKIVTPYTLVQAQKDLEKATTGAQLNEVYNKAQKSQEKDLIIAATYKRAAELKIGTRK